MKVLPKSFAGQLALLLVLALFAAQVASFLLFSRERMKIARDAFQEAVVDRTGTLILLLEDAPPELHARMLTAASSTFLQYSASSEPAAARGDDPTSREATLILAGLLGLRPRDVVVSVEPEPGRTALSDHLRSLWPRRPHGDRAPPARRPWFQASIALDGGTWLNISAGRSPGPPPFGGAFMVSLALSSLATLLVAVFVAGRMVRPMRRLADAADRFGRGEAFEPLPETGPDEARRSARAFNQMRERFERFLRDRTRMLAAISHDLRTPLTSLRLRAELVEDEETRDRLVETVEEMQNMSEATLAFIRADQSEEETRAVDLAALAESLAADLVELGHDVTVSDGDRPVVRCRPVALRRALRNLIENAVRYGERARLTVSATSGEARITVDDDGPGLPAGDLERVFEPFVRGEASRSRETGGIGLGLSIARSIVRSHGGDIRLENRPGGGLTAILSLPT